eukprot:CAMPEP_0194443790 /NCGR_PEP_ID=MMETSP0176-20130528/126906_1 /TAXON_ID=216777 /ORGANISM="Proboscia alata, Strain PI-D3" /LENGTH=975 /DNA_ID=CAMNT_0039270085 /DNA_START=542 /DNA_END=3469 /DNA_ORIENTATION=-
MWGTWTSGAKERIASALEKTGDALTERASAHVAKQRMSEQQLGIDQQYPSSAPTRPPIGPPPPPPVAAAQQWNSFLSNTRHAFENTKANLQQTHQEIVAATHAGQNPLVAAVDIVRSQNDTSNPNTAPFPRRTPQMPLDTEALRDAEVVYITDRVITMGHPAMQSSTNGDITPSRKLAAISQLLEKRHGDQYMVWNLSEMEYDYGRMNNQVLTYQFPGSPSPPLGMLLKLLLSIESWLKADERNVAVLHCLTGRGRTSTVLACFLCWTGEAGFHDVVKALEYIALCKRCTAEGGGSSALTIPSQRRYVSYFANMLDGVRPNQPPLILKRIVLSEAPKFGKAPVQETDTDGNSDNTNNTIMGCSPYLQIFKAGNLVLTTAATMSPDQHSDDLPFCTSHDGSLCFHIETVVQGDVLVRCRHLTQRGQRVSMFRAAFHTGYLPPRVLRLKKGELDGACSDKRFADDFFVDLIFSKCDENTAGQIMSGVGDIPGGGVTASSTNDGGGSGMNEASNRRSMGAALSSVPKQTSEPAPVEAYTYDSMLHRDSRFWNVIADRRKENMEKLASANAAGQNEQQAPLSNEVAGGDNTNSSSDQHVEYSNYGPTIGRRRDSAKLGLKSQGESGGSSSAKDGSSDGKEGKDGAKSTAGSSSAQKAMESFSIGGGPIGLDFDDDNDNYTAPASPAQPPKRDALMDALNELDDIDDEDDEDDEEEEVSFEEKPHAIDDGNKKEVDASKSAGAAGTATTDKNENTPAQIQSSTNAASSDSKSDADDDVHPASILNSGNTGHADKKSESATSDPKIDEKVIVKDDKNESASGGEKSIIEDAANTISSATTDQDDKEINVTTDAAASEIDVSEVPTATSPSGAVSITKKGNDSSSGDEPKIDSTAMKNETSPSPSPVTNDDVAADTDIITTATDEKSKEDDLDLDDLEEMMEGLGDDGIDDNIDDVAIDDFEFNDDDDAEMEDLENFLTNNS